MGKTEEAKTSLQQVLGSVLKSSQPKVKEQVQVKADSSEKELKLMDIWEAHQKKLNKPQVALNTKPQEQPQGLPFNRVAVIDLKNEETNPAQEAEARLRATMIALNTISLQVGHLFQKATEEVPKDLVKEKEELEVKNKKLTEELEILKKQGSALKEEKMNWEDERKKHIKDKKKLKEEVSQAQEDGRRNKEEAQQEAAKAKDCLEHFNLAVLLKMLEEMRTPPEEGVWLNQEQLEALMENMLEIISQHSQQILQSLKEEKQAEAHSNKQEEEAEEEEDKEEDEEDEDKDDDDKDDDDDNDEDNQQGGVGSSHKENQNKSDEREEEPDKMEEAKETGPSTSDEGKEKNQAKDSDNLRSAEAKWFKNKAWICNLVKKLEKDHKELKQLKEKIKLAKMTDKEGENEKRLVELKRMMKLFFKGWPKQHPHNKEKCVLPSHPSCIQILEDPPECVPTEYMGLGPKRTTFSLQSLAMKVELLLGNRPKFECMEDCKQAIREIRNQAQVSRQELEIEAQNLVVPPGEGHLQAWEQCLMKISRVMKQWYLLSREEVLFLEECIERLPDNPTLLYAIAPHPDELARFYPVLYPDITEPKDAEEYVELATEFINWRQQLDENFKAMKQMLQVQEGAEGEIFGDMFTAWAKHQNTLVKLCNSLLQHHIMTQRLPPEKQETANAGDLEVQWLAEKLLKARIETNKPVYKTWLATAYWCTQLARARLREDPQVIMYTSGGRLKRQRLHLFEKVPAAWVCTSLKPSKTGIELTVQKLKKEGEPYDQQKAEGLHSEDAQEFKDILKKVQESQLGQASKANKRKAKAKAKTSASDQDSEEEESDSN